MTGLFVKSTEKGLAYHLGQGIAESTVFGTAIPIPGCSQKRSFLTNIMHSNSILNVFPSCSTTLIAHQ